MGFYLNSIELPKKSLSRKFLFRIGAPGNAPASQKVVGRAFLPDQAGGLILVSSVRQECPTYNSKDVTFCEAVKLTRFSYRIEEYICYNPGLVDLSEIWGHASS